MYSKSDSAKRIQVSDGINPYAAYRVHVKHSQVVQFDFAVNCQVFQVEVHLNVPTGGWGGVGLRKLSELLDYRIPTTDMLSCFPSSM